MAQTSRAMAGIDRSITGTTYSLPDGELKIGEAIHAYPGKRLLAKATLAGATVVAKFYFGRWRGWPEWRRGVRGARALEAADLPCPALLFSGWLPAARAWLLVLEYIDPDRPWPPTGRPDDEVHRLTLETLALHHQAGIVQNDLNWTNFLPAGGRLHTLDSDRIRSRTAPLGVDRSLHNLARFYAYKSDFRAMDIAEGLRTYHELRGWPLATERQEQFLKTVYHRRLRVARGVAKRSLTGWKYYEKSYINNCFSIIDRRRIEPEKLRRRVREIIDTPPADGLLELNGRTLRVHGVAGRALPLRPGAAARTWLLAVMLRRLRIPAELPVGLFEERIGAIRVHGAVLTVARPVKPLLRQPHDSEETQVWFGQIVEIVARLHLAGLSHPDIQLQSFGITPEGDVLLVDWRALESRDHGRDPGSDVQRLADMLGIAPDTAHSALALRLPPMRSRHCS